MSQAELPNMPPAPPEPPAISERDLQKGIIDIARLFGWRVAHFRPARVRRGGREIYETPVAADGKGWPDLCLVRDRVLFIEIKVGRNTLSAEQAAWLEALRHAGQDARVWTDADWFGGLVEAELRRGTKHERSAA